MIVWNQKTTKSNCIGSGRTKQGCSGNINTTKSLIIQGGKRERGGLPEGCLKNSLRNHTSNYLSEIPIIHGSQCAHTEFK